MCIQSVLVFWRGFTALKKCSVGKFLNGQCVQGVQARREFHVSHSSAIFAKEIFVGNFVKVYYVLSRIEVYHFCLIHKIKLTCDRLLYYYIIVKL